MQIPLILFLIARKWRPPFALIRVCRENIKARGTFSRMNLTCWLSDPAKIVKLSVYLLTVRDSYYAKAKGYEKSDLQC